MSIFRNIFKNILDANSITDFQDSSFRALSEDYKYLTDEQKKEFDLRINKLHETGVIEIGLNTRKQIIEELSK